MSDIAAELRTLIGDLVPEETAGRSDAEESAAALHLWDRLSALGLHRVGMAEDRGGSGGSLEELLLITEELAARGAGVPIVEASVADWILGHAGTPSDELSTVALLDHPLDTDSGNCTARLPTVPWARYAARVVVVTPGAAPLAFRTDHPSVAVEPGVNLAGEPRDTVVLNATPVTAATPATPPAYDAVRARLALLWSSAVTGAAHGAYRLTKAYVAERHQFGAPLLKIPAVGGGLARMRVQLAQADTAMSLARDAAASHDPAPAVATARITTAAAATDIARLAHQLHGAMGITREYPLHRYTRRLWAWRDSIATERHWAASLGRRAADEGEPGLWTALTATAR